MSSENPFSKIVFKEKKRVRYLSIWKSNPEHTRCIYSHRTRTPTKPPMLLLQLCFWVKRIAFIYRENKIRFVETWSEIQPSKSSHNIVSLVLDRNSSVLDYRIPNSGIYKTEISESRSRLCIGKAFRPAVMTHPWESFSPNQSQCPEWRAISDKSIVSSALEVTRAPACEVAQVMLIRPSSYRKRGPRRLFIRALI